MDAFLSNTSLLQRILKLVKEEGAQQFQDAQDKLVVAEERVQKLISHMLVQAEASGPAVDVKTTLAPAGELAVAMAKVASSDEARAKATCLQEHVSLAESYLTLRATFADQFSADDEPVKRLGWFNDEGEAVLAFQAKVASTELLESLQDLQGLTALREKAAELSGNITVAAQSASLAQWEIVIKALQGPQEEAEKWKAKLVKPSWDEARKAAKPLFDDAFARSLKAAFTKAQKEPRGHL